jgi:hypothetical protein
MARSYKIRKFQNGRNSKGDAFWNYSLTIPTDIATKLPMDRQYTCELTKEGILFKPVETEAPPVELPAWAQKKPIENGSPKPKRDNSRPRPGRKKEEAKA